MKMNSKLTLIFGGQFGSEGKGQIAAYIAKKHQIDIAVRVGGPNAGHTFLLPNGAKQVVQSVPAPVFMQPDVLGVIGAAGMVIEDILIKEMQDYLAYWGNPAQLMIDSNAVMIRPEHMEQEAALKGKIGSTGEGVGAATAAKVMRDPSMPITMDDLYRMRKAASPALDRTYIRPTAEWLNQTLHDTKANVLIEGTQGFGLSLHTGGFYPFCTSRECTPQGILSDSGIHWDSAGQFESIMVVRTYPIRVGGNSGPLANEIDWEQLSKLTGGYVKVPEITTVTKKPRRIAEIDYSLLLRAVNQCRPTAIALTFFDYWFPEIATAVDPSALTQEHWHQINYVESILGVPVKYLSTGFGSVIPLRINK